MQRIDFLIGALLMNAMPHFVLGTWRARMFSAFGYGNGRNIAYGLLCYALSLGLYLYAHGWLHLWTGGTYLGASAILLIYFLTGGSGTAASRKESDRLLSHLGLGPVSMATNTH